jgi:hypothetical protein
MDLPCPDMDLTAPIIPNEGLGGIPLRAAIIDIQNIFSGLGVLTAGHFNLHSPFDARYYLGKGEIVVCVDVRNGKIFMLSACEGYKAGLWGKIFIGMKVSDALKLEPQLFYDEAEEVILCKDCPGLSIDISEIDPPVELVPELTITAINVYADEIWTSPGQKGRW